MTVGGQSLHCQMQGTTHLTVLITVIDELVLLLSKYKSYLLLHQLNAVFCDCSECLRIKMEK